MKNKGLINIKWSIVFILYFLFLIIIFIMAYLRVIPTEISLIPYYDTLGHFILLGLTAYLLHRMLNRRTISILNLKCPLAPLIILLFALGEESFQILSSYRTFSLSDMTADFMGILTFYCIDKVWLMRKRVIK